MNWRCRLAPAKTRIGFQVRMIFAAVNKLGRQGLDAHVILTGRLDHPRFTRIEEISPRCFVHHFRIKDQSELDGEVSAWLKEAYRVGQQTHLKRWRRLPADALHLVSHHHLSYTLHEANQITFCDGA